MQYDGNMTSAESFGWVSSSGIVVPFHIPIAVNM